MSTPSFGLIFTYEKTLAQEKLNKLTDNNVLVKERVKRLLIRIVNFLAQVSSRT